MTNDPHADRIIQDAEQDSGEAVIAFIVFVVLFSIVILAISNSAMERLGL